MANDNRTVIESDTGFKFIDLKELIEYRDLFYFLVWRNIKVLYAQTIMGFSWAIVQPVVQILIFSVIFGKVAKLDTDGIPYVLFSTVAIIPWTYISQAINQSSQSLISGQNMLGKVYFPRLLYPFTSILSKMVDFAISMVVAIIVCCYYRVPPTWNLIFFPLFIVIMMFTACGTGLWLSAMAIRFRDVKHAMPFVIRMAMYTAPIVYSASSIPDKYRFIYSINPIVSVIEGFRSCLLGTSLSWGFIWPGIITSMALFISGVFYFRRLERIFVDVI